MDRRPILGHEVGRKGCPAKRDGGWWGMDLDLSRPVRTHGRPSRPVAFAVIRELNGADMASLDISLNSSAPTLKGLRTSHHHLAKCLASGMKNADASRATGYSPSRISILQSDSTFMELIEHYRGIVDEAFLDVNQRLATFTADALEIAHERLLDDPDKIADSDLHKYITSGLDRTGYGPQSKSTQVNVNVDLSARLDAARNRVKQIEGRATVSEEPGS